MRGRGLFESLKQFFYAMAIDGRQLTAAGGGEGKNIGDRGHREREDNEKKGGRIWNSATPGRKNKGLERRTRKKLGEEGRKGHHKPFWLSNCVALLWDPFKREIGYFNECDRL